MGGNDRRDYRENAWINRRADDSKGLLNYDEMNSIQIVKQLFLSYGDVGILTGLLLVPALLLLLAFMGHNRLLGVLALELAVCLVLILDLYRVRSRLPLFGSPRKLVATLGWEAVTIASLVVLLVTIRTGP